MCNVCECLRRGEERERQHRLDEMKIEILKKVHITKEINQLITK